MLPCPPVPFAGTLSPPQPPLLLLPSFSAFFSFSRFVQCFLSRFNYYLDHRASQRSCTRTPTCVCPRNIRNTVAITRHCRCCALRQRRKSASFLPPPFLTRLSLLLLFLFIRVNSRLTDHHRQVRVVTNKHCGCSGIVFETYSG